MASKLALHLTKNLVYSLKDYKIVSRIGRTKYVVNKFSNFRFGNVCFQNRMPFKGIKIPVLRQKILNYRSNLKYIEKRVLPSKIRFPDHLSDFKYLNKGCNGVICTIGNEKNVIAKQAYKFDPYHNNEEDQSNENKILDKLQLHPNIIQKVNETQMNSQICQDPEFVNSCPDVEHSGLTNTLILERMEMSLEDFLKIKQLDMEDRIDILSQILEAQVYMNRKSICHRDMKLSNVLVKLAPESRHLKQSRKFIIKVADFDCAIDFNNFDREKFSHQGANICTAPEVLNIKEGGPLNIGKLYSKNDIWAIGGMAYEIFGFENPFTKINAQSYSLSDLPPLGSVPQVVQRVIHCLLHPDSAYRYQSCVAADILQMFRLKSLMAEEVFGLFKEFSLHMMVAFCYLNNLYFTGSRFLSNPQRMKFVLNYINT